MGWNKPGESLTVFPFEQVSVLGLGESRLLRCRQSVLLLFERTDGEQALIPAVFQLAGDKPVIRINGVVLPPSPRCLIAGLLDRQLDLMTLLGSLGAPDFHRANRGLNA